VRNGFTWIDGERLIRFGRGALAEAPRLLAERGFAGYALLTTERAARDAPALVDGAAVVLHVPSRGVAEAAAAVRVEVEARPLVALGGGRVIDSAKAIAGADALPCAALPTTLSGAEMTRIHRMPAGVEEFRLVRPSLVIGEPSLMASQPLPGLAASAMNALGHAAEALYTPYANPVADRAGLDAAALIARGLAREEPERPALALGALLAGYAIGSAGYAVHHVLCQTLVRLTGSPHAETNAVILPHSLKLMSVRAPEPLGRLARALGAQDDSAELVYVRAADLAARSGALRLSELGVERDRLDDVVTAALGRAELRNTPEPPGRRELTDLLERAY
jgi:alcohol dehydrogenase class IV